MMVFLALGLSGALTSCDKNDDGPYKVQVRYTAATTFTDYNSWDTGAVIGFLLTDETGKTVKGNVGHTMSGNEQKSGDTGEVNMAKNDIIEVDMRFPNVDTPQKLQAMPTTTFIKTEILVNGKVKKTLLLDKNTPLGTSTIPSIQEKLKVGDL